MNLLHFPPVSAETRLRRFFTYVYDNFEFYRHRFDISRADPADPPVHVLDRVPVFEPEEFTVFEREIFRHVSTQRFLTDHTTGTTGKRKIRFATARDDAAEALLCTRFFRQCGIKPPDRVLAIDIDSADIYVFLGNVLEGMGVRQFVYGSLSVDFSASADPLLLTDPTIIITVPSVLCRVLSLLTSRSAAGKLRHLRSIIYLGESMPRWLRRHLEDVLQLEVFSFYGSTEIGSMAGECRAHDGIHIFNDSVIPTILNPTELGGCFAGEVVWTTTHFLDQPLVKYATRDYVVMSAAPCGCGLVTPRLHSVKRLQDQFLIYGHKFGYEAFTNAVAEGVAYPEFLQIVVEDDCDCILLRFLLPTSLGGRERAIRKVLSTTDEMEYFLDLGFVKLDIKFVDSPVLGSRKTRRIIDRRYQ